MLKHSLVALAAMGVGLIGLPVTQASAFPVAPAVGAGTNPLTVEVKHRDNDRHGRRDRKDWDSRRHGDRCNSWSNHCRYRYGGYYYENPWWLLPMVGAGIALGAAADNDGYGSRHVEWCLDHYRSYNVRSNTWVSYSGRVRQCVSPYGP